MTTVEAVGLLYQALQSALLAVLPILAILIVKFVKQEWQRVHLPEWVVTYALLAVKAAEQAGLAGLIEDKKTYAIAALQAFLDAHGIQLDAAALDAAIEDAVFSLNALEDFTE